MRGALRSGGRVFGALTHAARDLRSVRPRPLPAAVLGWTLGSILDFLIEDSCLICGRSAPPRGEAAKELDGPGGYFHEPLDVRFLFGLVGLANRPLCARCSQSLVAARTVGTLGRRVGPCGIETTHGERFDGRRGPGLDPEASPGPVPGDSLPISASRGVVSVVSPFMTSSGVLRIVHSLKFGGHVGLARPIARSMAWAYRRFDPSPGGGVLLVSTPMDARSLKRRGFNHAEKIAVELSIELAIPMSCNMLRKARCRRPQSKTPRQDRAANVRGAFECDPGTPGFAGKSVLLVDDLVTTGATAAACGAALLESGANSVTVLCLGRAM